MAKCYVCKFVNAAAEARRHPNSVTVETAKSLRERMREYGKNPNHTCLIHESNVQRAIDIDRANKDLTKAEELRNVVEYRRMK